MYLKKKKQIKCKSSIFKGGITAEKNKKFYKEQFLKSGLYKDKKDLINSLLNEEEMYSKNDVDKIIKKYMEVIL